MYPSKFAHRATASQRDILPLSDFPIGAKIGLFVPNWVGDACMATPTIRTLHANLPTGGQLIGIGRRAPLSVLDNLPYFSRTLTYKPRGRKPARGRRSLAWALRREKLDLAILLTNSISTAAISYIGGAKNRLGFNRDGRRLLLTHSIRVEQGDAKQSPDNPLPTLDYYLAIADYLGCNITDKRMELKASSSDNNITRQLLARFNWPAKAQYVVLNSGGAFGQSKVWPSAKLASLARMIISETNYNVVFHCGPAERSETNRLATECDDHRIRSPGEFEDLDLPFGLSRGLLAQSSAVVSTDSGPRHMAVALNKPVVSLFGPTQSNGTTTYNLPEQIVELNLDCRGCYKRKCPLGHHRCMTDIAVKRVFDALQTALEQSSHRLPVTAA